MPEILAPPILQGTDQQQIAALRDYLVYVAKQMDSALDQVDESVKAAIERTANAGVSGATQTAITQQTSVLRQMIVNQAQIVRHEIDELTVTLNDKFSADSDLGQFMENTTASIDVQAGQIQQNISDIQVLTGSFGEYVHKTEGYIRYGIVARVNNIPIYGVAIGQDLAVDGDDVITGNFRTILTSNKLSFYENDVEVAYISSNTLHITDAQVSNKLLLGQNKWEINTTNGFTIKWVG